MGASLLLLWPLVKSSHRPAMLGGKIGSSQRETETPTSARARPRFDRTANPAEADRGLDLRAIAGRTNSAPRPFSAARQMRLRDCRRVCGRKHNARPRHALRERAFGRVPPVLSAPGFAWPLRTRQWQKPVLAQPRLLFARSAPAWQSIA